MVQVGVTGIICTTVHIVYILSAIRCEMQSKAMSNVYLFSMSKSEKCLSFSFC